MRMYENGVLISITCNMCEKTVDSLQNDKYVSEQEPFREFDELYGYGSEIYDLKRLKFDLCEHCIEDLTKRFKIPVEVSDYTIMEDGKGGVFIGEIGVDEDIKNFPDRVGLEEDLFDRLGELLNGSRYSVEKIVDDSNEDR